MAYQLIMKVHMENLDKKPENKLEEIESHSEPKKRLNPKVFLIGLPLFVVQLIAVYFITANVLLSKMEQDGGSTEKSSVEMTDKVQPESVSVASKEFGKHLYLIEDLIINPANTGGQRLLLSTIGIDLTSANEVKELETKAVLVKDVVISVLASKTLGQLESIAYRDSLRSELADNIVRRMPDVNIKSVYFSKYIIQ